MSDILSESAVIELKQRKARIVKMLRQACDQIEREPLHVNAGESVYIEVDRQHRITHLHVELYLHP